MLDGCMFVYMSWDGLRLICNLRAMRQSDSLTNNERMLFKCQKQTFMQ